MAKRKAESLAVLAPPHKRFLSEPQRCLPRAAAAARASGKRKMEPAEEPSGAAARLPQRPHSAPAVSMSNRHRCTEAPKRPRVNGSGAHSGEQPETDPDPGAEGESRRRGSAESGRRNHGGSQDQQQQQQDLDECWQYNSFHYWRIPLPPVDFSEILQLEVDNMAEELAPAIVEGIEMEMETCVWGY